MYKCKRERKEVEGDEHGGRIGGLTDRSGTDNYCAKSIRVRLFGADFYCAGCTYSIL